MIINFQFCQVEKIWRLVLSVNILNPTIIYTQERLRSKFYVMCILPQYSIQSHYSNSSRLCLIFTVLFLVAIPSIMSAMLLLFCDDTNSFFTGNERICAELWRKWQCDVFIGVNDQKHVRRKSQCDFISPCPDSTKGTHSNLIVDNYLMSLLSSIKV